ncbi:MAG: alanine--tRNA ligase-related protein, partial [Bacillota bacterium]
MNMNGNKLRNKFLEFFREKNHLIMPSAPLVPENDPTLLWINAGMAPFKPYFSGKVTPPSSRIATSQKCIRTNDIKNVGKTARHHTFFEMLGNFSFGDYFKEKAIIWSWEFVTEVLNLEEDRLWVTIYKDDDEAFNIWKNIVGVKEEKIVRMGKDENFWQHGTGPCGPCSELHYDRGEEYGNSSEDIIGGEGDRFLEIWNLVFTQYEYTDEGEYIQLPRKNIDTGMGLERVASILQGVDSNFETDLIKPIIEDLESKSSYEYKHDEEITMAYRLIADHIRGIT